jgi:signal recognition particle subunit SRP54
VLEALQNRFEKTLKTLKGEAKIRPAHIESALQEIRTNLLEADVQFQVVKRFIERVKDRALGSKVLDGVSPYQQFLYILREEMLEILGKSDGFELSGKPPVVILMVGLQGAGKTTSSGKLALYLKRKMKRRPLLVSTDVRRPAAIEQLERLAKDVKVDYFKTDSMLAVERAQRAMDYATTYGVDTVIVDTAGRLSIDAELMSELGEIRSAVNPKHILYVADSMSGQAGLEVMEGFSSQVALTGAILTKTDADARGGLALSVRESLGVPLFFVGTGEKMEGLDLFVPDRWVGRILGMGDLQGLVEKVQDAMSDDAEAEKKAEKVAQKALKGQMSLRDFQEQMKMLSKLGSLKGLMGMIPGVSGLASKIDSEAVEKRLKRIDAMINSMTVGERENPDLLNGGRKKRVALGSGTSVEELNQFLKEFWQMQKMMKSLKGKPMGRFF